MGTRQRPHPNVARYDRTTIWLHWATVGLIVALWTIGQTADLLPRGPLRSGVWSVHVLLGMATGLVLIARLVWRLEFGRMLPPAGSGILAILAKLTHYALYILLAVVVALGFADALYRGFNLFGFLPLPQIGAGDPAMRHSINEWHELAANLLVLVAAFHGAAALLHQYVWRDRLIERMIP